MDATQEHASKCAASPHLLSLTATFTPERRIHFPNDPQRTLHAAIHRLIESMDPALSQAIHDASIKPLVIGPLMQLPAVDSQPAHLCARMCALNNAVAQALLHLRDKSGAAPLVIPLNGQPYEVRLLDRHSAQHEFPPARSTTYTALFSEALPDATITLRFRSPTAFRNKGRYFTHPDPRHVFTSLARRWNAFSIEQLPDRFIDAIPTNVTMVEKQTSVVQISLGAHVQPGFVGMAQYRIAGDQAFKHAISALASYAEFSAVGARTAFGMGQTKRLS